MKLQLNTFAICGRQVLIFLIFLGVNEIANAQFLSGILPKYGAVVHQSNTTLSWNPLPGAATYNVILAQDPLFTQNVQSSGSITITNWTTPSLVFGDWYWKVEGTTIAGTIVGEIEKFTRFDPSAQSSLSLWLKADAGVSLDASNLVQTWTDQSPSALQFTQTTTSKRPEITASSFGGFPSLSFTAGTKFLSGGDVLDLGLNSRSFYVIGKMAATNQTFFSKTLAALAATRYGIIKDGASTAFICQTDAVTQNHVYSSLNSTNFGLYNAQINRGSGQVRLFLNGLSMGSNMTNSNYNWNSSYRFLIGAYNNATDNGELLPLNGNISEMIFIDTDDPIERIKTENYVKFKYHSFNAGADIYKTDYCSATIILPSGFSNILWSNGSTSQAISVTEPVLLTVQATDPLGFVWQDTILVTYPTIPSPLNTGICAGQANTWNADMGAGFTYLWSNGATTPSLNITTPGNYFVKVTDQLGCFKYSDTLNFTIDNYSQTATLGPDVNLCSGNFLSLQSGAGETISYEWNGETAAGQPASYQVNTSGIYSLESTNINGCVAQDTINVNIVGIAPVANFSVANVCDGFSAAFDDNSAPAGAAPIDGWQWSFGDNQTSNQQNPSHSYNLPGSYPVALFVSQGLCGAYFYDTIQVFENPTANFGYTGHCQGESIQFSNLSAAGSGAITNYYWDFGMPQTGAYNNSIIPIPNRIFDDPGSYNVEFTITDANGCKDSITQILVIDPTPQVELLVENSCQNQEANIINNTPTGNDLIYNWNFGDNTTSILSNPTKVYQLNGLYLITLSVGNQFGCTGIQSATITINPTPIASIDVGPSCVGSFGSITDVSSVLNGTIDSSLWVVNASDTLSGALASYLWNTSGQQGIELTTFSNAGCSASTSLFFDITDTLDVAFQIGSNIAAAGDPIAFKNNSIGSGVFLWNFGDGNFANEVNAEHTYGNNWIDSTFNVLLIGLNSAGCIDSAVQSLTILEPLVDISLDQLFLDEENGWYTVGVVVTNNGTSNVTSIPFSLETEKGALFNETFSGILYPTKDTIYVFNGKPPATGSVKDIEQAFICVNGIAYSITGLEETLLADNGICENLTDDPVALLPVYPNPAATVVNISLLVVEEANVGIDILDSRGRTVRTVLPFQSQQAGNYNYEVNIRGLSSGAYVIRMKTDDKTITEKLLIQQ
jgi:PKD repeat protein